MRILDRVRQMICRKEQPAPSPAKEPAPPASARPELSQWYTYGNHMYRTADEVAEVVLTNEQKGIRRVIVDDDGRICRFPGIDPAVEDLPQRCREPIVRFRTDFERKPDGRILMIWQVQPDGRYWEDEDGFGSSSDEEICLYAHIDGDGRFDGPFRLYKCGAERFYVADQE